MTWLKLGVGLWLFLQAVTTESAEQRLSGDALLQAAFRYERGAGVGQDYAKAYRLYCLAAALDNRHAMYRLGWIRFNGRSVPRDRRVAVGWFRRAALRKDAHALRLVRKFRDVPPRRDSLCPLTSDPKRMDRNAIATWAKLLGNEFGVDPHLVLAVIKTESNFNPSALSPSLAYGLMQLMPATARRFAVNRMHPVENMIGGVLYLRWLLRHFKGNVHLALAGYNAGEHAVHRYHGLPPYRETRRYVHRILSDYGRRRHPVPKSLSF